MKTELAQASRLVRPSSGAQARSPLLAAAASVASTHYEDTKTLRSAKGEPLKSGEMSELYCLRYSIAGST